jgi:small subunit ribosomal protein S16
VAVKIRLMRVGKTKQPSYRVVVADERSPRDGRIIEAIGQYAPRQEPSLVEIDEGAAMAWLRKGAQPSDSALRLLTIAGIWEKFETERGGPVNTHDVRRKREMARSGAPPRQRKKAAPEAPAADSPADVSVQEAATEAEATSEETSE